MTLGQDDLTHPIGHDVARRERPWLALLRPQLFVLGAAGTLLLLAGWLALLRDPLGSTPYAMVPLEGEAIGLSDPKRSDDALAALRSSVSGPPAPNAEIRLAPAPDPRLVETVRYGAIPRIGDDGARPAEVYARPAPPPQGKGRVAIIIGGLGLSPARTAEALTRLPPEASLAFSVYGADVAAQALRAREAGHEVFLQAPMEPFDYPDNDPGPHTLTADASAAENQERLRWAMARFPGFVGVANAMGSRFTSREAALGPVLAELAGRGLVYVDDGSSTRSLALQVAHTAQLLAIRADVTLDAVAAAGEIDAQLATLDKLARDRGWALGWASPQPLTLERIARWARTLEQNGVQLVPASALIFKPGRM